MATWTDRSWYSAEGLRLHYRDYAGPHDKPPILCIPGLTRNSRDFEPIADRYAGDWRVIAVDLRGRGHSEHDPDKRHYAPSYYVADILKLLDQLGIADAVFVGTSLGGICTMVLASTDADRIAGALINDIGPEIDPAGIDRIGGYVGKDVLFESWDDAAARAPRTQSCRCSPTGRKANGTASSGGFVMRPRTASASNMTWGSRRIFAWPPKRRRPMPGRCLRALAGRPVAILRGELSDLLSREVAERMAAELGDDAELVIIPDTGHAPSLEEPEALAAFDRLLERVLAREA